MGIDIRASAKTYLSQYPQDTVASIPNGTEIFNLVADMEKLLCPYLQHLGLNKIKGVVLRDARLAVTSLLLGREIDSFLHGDALWMNEVAALQAWINTAKKSDIKLALTKVGWLPKPTETALARCIERGVTPITRKRLERFQGENHV